MVLTKGVAVLFFTAVLVVMALLAGVQDFLQGFLFAFEMMAWIGAYDTFFIDWVLFANMKRFRLEGTEHMDKAYHQKWFHLKGMLFPGIVFALLPRHWWGGTCVYHKVNDIPRTMQQQEENQ